MKFEAGYSLTWTSALGTMTGVIRSVTPGKNAAGEMIEWAIVDYYRNGRMSNVCLPLNAVGVATLKISARPQPTERELNNLWGV